MTVVVLTVVIVVEQTVREEGNVCRVKYLTKEKEGDSIIGIKESKL